MTHKQEERRDLEAARAEAERRMIGSALEREGGGCGATDSNNKSMIRISRARCMPIYHCQDSSAQMLNGQNPSGETEVGQFQAALAVSGQGRPVSGAVTMPDH
ncbi:hypothetical protein BD309DRAFT_912255 [Dichomitus squalens]|nr:hypothetical protein BD309DRAFT_912255 [Dichomitus squalens]